MMWWPWSNMGGLWMGLGALFMFVFWGIVIALVVWLIVRLARSGKQTASENPLEIAKARYAKGEITKEEFEQLKKDLS